MSRKKGRVSGSDSASDGCLFLTNIDEDVLVPSDVSSYPVVRAYVPVSDVWRATGFGLSGVIRQKPDGLWRTAFFCLSLLDGGIQTMFGKDSMTAAACDDFIASTMRGMPPMEEGPLSLTADYVWGAHAFGEAQERYWPQKAEGFLALVPKPSGPEKGWLTRLTGKDGLTPSRLLEVISENPVPDGMDEGMEIMILTKMVFEVTDRGYIDYIIAKLRGRDPEFCHVSSQAGTETFDWTRKYPRGHWSPLKALGGRQVLGSVNVEHETLTAEAKTLSMAACLAGLLKEAFRGRIRLREASWMGAQEILKRGALKS